MPVAMGVQGPLVPTVLNSSVTVTGAAPPFAFHFILRIVPTAHCSPSMGDVNWIASWFVAAGVGAVPGLDVGVGVNEGVGVGAVGFVEADGAGVGVGVGAGVGVGEGFPTVIEAEKLS